MSRLLPDRLWSDARHYQILALTGLLLINFTSIDFGARPLASCLLRDFIRPLLSA